MRPANSLSVRFSSIKRRSLQSTVVFVLLVLCSGLVHGQVFPVDQFKDNDHQCAGDYGNVGSCTSKEISLASVGTIEFEGKNNAGDTCYIGEQLTVTLAEVTYAINAQARYNLLLWVGGSQGVDPSEGAPINGTGRCAVSSVPGPFDQASLDPANPFLDLDQNNLDVCGDIEAFNGQVTRDFKDLQFQCQDNDGDGFADVNVLLTWQQNSSANCGTGPAEEPTFVIGSPSKCSEQLVNSDLEIVDPATLTVVKNTIGDDDSFGFSWGSANNTSTLFSLDTSTGPNTASQQFLITDGLGDSDYVVGELLTPAQIAAGWTFVDASCVDGNGTEIGTLDPPSNGVYGISGMTIDEGDDVTCTFTNAAPASLTVVKTSIGGNAVFGFGTDVPGLATSGNTFSLDTAPSGTASRSVTGIAINDAVNGDDYFVSEAVPNGWQLASATCDNGDASQTDTINLTLDPGDDVTCTFTNTLNASVTIVKNTLGGDGSFDFTTDALAAVPSGEFNITTNNNSGAQAFLGALAAGTYTVTEIVPAGWDLTGLSCVEDGIQDSTVDLPNAEATLRLENGESITCTFVNRERGTIEIVKSTVPAGSDVFGFTSTIPNNAAFDTTAGTTTTISDVLPGTYTVTENDPGLLADPYALTALTCVDSDVSGSDSTGDVGTRTATVNLDPGETVTCSYTNTALASVTVRKVVTVDGPSANTFSFTSPDFGDFQLGPVVAGAPEETVFSDLLPGNYSVSETDPTADGWALLTASCNDGSAANSIDLAAGEDVICVFTNAPLGSATVIKNTVGGDGIFDFDWGTAGNANVPEGEAASFPLSTAGGSAFRDFSFTLLTDTEYDLTETGVPATSPDGLDWTLTNIGCTEDVSNDSTFNPGLNGADATIVAQSGETVACTFTNTLDGKLIITKVTDPAGAADTFTFTGDVAGDLTDGNSLELVAQPGIYGSAETVPTGWTLTDISCTGAINSTVTIGGDADFNDGDTDVSVDLAAGEIVECTFTNEKEGSITIVKNAVGGDGVFAFGGDLGDFQIDTAVDTDEAFTGLLGGTYLVSETVPAGWGLTDISCTGATNSVITIGGAGDFDPGDTGVSVQLADGENIVCTFTNTALGSITIAKTTDPSPDAGTTAFGFTGDVAGSLADGDSQTTSNLLPGEYTSTELDAPGWDLTDISCDDADSAGDTGTRTATFQVSAGEDVTCTFTNRVQRAQIVVDKITDPTGSSQSFDFTLTGTGVNQAFALTDGATPYNSGDLLPSAQNSTYSVAEASVDGWTQVSATCDNGDNPASISLEPGDVVTCTFQNAIEASRIIVDKVTDPADSAQSFDFTLTGTDVNQAFTLTGPGVPHNSGVLLPTSENGTYSVAESLPAGWTQDSATCSDGSPVNAVDLDPGETVTCTFTNSIQRGQIIVDKVTDPSGSTQSFDFTLTGTGVNQAFALADATAPYGSGPLLPTSENGTYSVAEAAVNGWDMTSAVCSDGSNPAAIDLAPGETVTCTFTNTIQRGNIVVDKVTLPSGSTQSFDFTLTGTDVNQAFALTDGAPAYDSGDLLPSLENGTYAVAEAAVAGWDQTGATCSNGSPVTAVTVAPGETVTCTFTNTERGEILVDKVTDPSGSTQSFDFTLTGTGVNQAFSLTDEAPVYSSGELLPSTDNGTYAVAEVPVDGWDQISASCDDGSPVNAVSVDPGEVVTCTFQNAIEASRIIVDKVTDPDDSSEVFDFTLSGDGNTVDFQLTGPGVPFNSGELTPSTEAGTYSVAETVPDDWDLTSATCDDGSPVDAIDVAPNETVTCTFTNTIKRGTIVVDKVTDPAGSTQSFDFTLTGTGVDQAFSLTGGAQPFSLDVLPTSENGTYAISESAVADWVLDSAVCDDGSPVDAVDVAAGETVTCTFTNVQAGGPLPFAPMPVPVDNPWALLMMLLSFLGLAWYYRPVPVHRR